MKTDALKCAAFLLPRKPREVAQAWLKNPGEVTLVCPHPAQAATVLGVLPCPLPSQPSFLHLRTAKGLLGTAAALATVKSLVVSDAL